MSKKLKIFYFMLLIILINNINQSNSNKNNLKTTIQKNIKKILLFSSIAIAITTATYFILNKNIIANNNTNDNQLNSQDILIIENINNKEVIATEAFSIDNINKDLEVKSQSDIETNNNILVVSENINKDIETNNNILVVSENINEDLITKSQSNDSQELSTENINEIVEALEEDVNQDKNRLDEYFLKNFNSFLYPF